MEFIRLAHRIYKKNEDGKVICEIEFPEIKKGECSITHTFVDDDYRGMGLAKTLVEEAIKTIEARGEKVSATCSYAKKVLDKKKNKE